MLRPPKWLVWVCLLVVVVAACTGAAADHFSAVLVPAGLVWSSIEVRLTGTRARLSAEQTTSLLALLPSRAPPAL